MNMQREAAGRVVFRGERRTGEELTLRRQTAVQASRGGEKEVRSTMEGQEMDDD